MVVSSKATTSPSRSCGNGWHLSCRTPPLVEVLLVCHARTHSLSIGLGLENPSSLKQCVGR
ncbi:atp dependent rna helicase [Moniliophthora roreri]|nr:atp dependent rna helicase [Moniliophthora roreri]